MPLFAALSALLVLLFSTTTAMAMPRPDRHIVDRVDVWCGEQHLEIEFESASLRCSDGRPPCRAVVRFRLPEGTTSFVTPFIVERLTLDGSPIEPAEGRSRHVMSEPIRASVEVTAEGFVGTSTRVPRGSMGTRHLLFRARTVRHALRMAPIGDFRVENVPSEGDVTEAREGTGSVEIEETSPPSLLRSGGLVLFVGRAMVGTNGIRGFSTHLGWELAPKRWLAVGLSASFEAKERLGGIAMVELVPPLGPLGSVTLGVGLGFDVDIGSGEVRVPLRLKASVQILMFGLTFHAAIGRGHRRGILGLQITL